MWWALAPAVASQHLGEAQQGVQVHHGAVQHGEEQDGHAGEHHVVHGCADVVHQRLRRQRWSADCNTSGTGDRLAPLHSTWMASLGRASLAQQVDEQPGGMQDCAGQNMLSGTQPCGCFWPKQGLLDQPG